MSSTVLREKRQTTIPADICEAAQLHRDDQLEWRFEGGEIRVRKLIPAIAEKKVVAKLVKRGGRMMFVSPVPISEESIAAAVAEERASR